ncbi:hypothetical protein SAMD00019534_076460 [Acytostelium subglobosum LB1]|uniref:hypothetical protein n=1 Tax=Acytostelium subglobosum LB1 TaxID=1410327 RepID=UPI0006448129|nr:hypothetical protein SAMD00019534_076460 [Acytostelium subglobosum LB1]GAM24471.1 hypothetical protein SAMD00019534_076460 [Acytostelium subglobosum LB1]|eukprot:XP_012752797.1 hypothetical protein SAMD00019534_076460 [Acytostelium subglobosum LB1]
MFSLHYDDEDGDGDGDDHKDISIKTSIPAPPSKSSASSSCSRPVTGIATSLNHLKVNNNNKHGQYKAHGQSHGHGNGHGQIKSRPQQPQAFSLEFHDDDDDVDVGQQHGVYDDHNDHDDGARMDVDHMDGAHQSTTTDLQQQQQQVNYDYQKKVPFSVFCELMERISKITKHSEKKKQLSIFFNNYKDENFFPLLRLLLPHLDKDRQVYGLKEKTLAKIYVDILGIAGSSIDATRLVNWKKSTSNEVGGDFGTAVYLSLKNRCVQKGRLSMADVNIALDGLVLTEDRKEKTIILKRVLRHTTCTEQKWFVRVILKEMKTGMSEKSILAFLHPDAMNLFNISCSLQKVCDDLKGNRNTALLMVAAGADPKVITLGQPVKPMLANRKPIDSVISILEDHPFVVETKYDGERIQLHKDGDTIKLFSRNSNDCTYIYANLLGPIVREAVSVDRCIIDGELLVWDTISQRFEEFGKLKTLALGGKDAASDTLNNNYGKQLCYIAFDIIYVRDQSVMELPLSQRMSILKRCVRVKPRQFEVSEHKPCQTTADILAHLDGAILNREEGIMIKNLDSIYVPGERKDKWIKIKPEYLDGVGDDLDLVIVGGYYGSGVGRRGGTISHFMLGVRNPEEPDNVFYSFCKVGSGYSDAELSELQKLLDPHWQPFNTSNPPRCLQLAEPFREKPDVWIDPTRSCALQIKAAQLVPTEKYRATFTLRFPRVVRIRTDKDWTECLEYPQLLELAQEFEGRYAKRKFELLAGGGGGTDGDGAGGKKKRRGAAAAPKPRRTVGLLSIFQDTDTSNVLPSNNIFEGVEFCVIKGDRTQHTKAALEIMIVANGGTKVQYPSHRTNYVVSSKEVVKIQNLINSGTIDIIHFQWIVDCVAAGRRLPLGPKYMIFTTEATRTLFLQDIDPYGDSFTVDTNEADLNDSFIQVAKQRKASMSSSGGGSNQVGQAEFDRLESNEQSTYIESNSMELIKNKIQFYGGVVSVQFDQAIQYVVIDSQDTSRLTFLKARLEKLDNSSKKRKIVTVEGVEQFINRTVSSSSSSSSTTMDMI